MTTPTAVSGTQNHHDNQFRLVEIQAFNWGTFGGCFSFAISPTGHLFVGPSGSGKSTILDGHSSLLTPPKWLDYNVAAREMDRAGRDRNPMTYVRGAWAEQTAESGEGVCRYLRTESTWSAIVETYRTARGRTVVLAQVLWVKGRSTTPADIRKLFLTLERDLRVTELEFFPTHGFDVRRFKLDLPDASVFHEFSAYQERFRRLLCIDSERALRLLHKTQSAKNLGDLNSFLRNFMLDEPEAPQYAQRLVDEFVELNEAHQAVVTAREQIRVLQPARDKFRAYEDAGQTLAKLEEMGAGIDTYVQQLKRRLLQQERDAVHTDLEGLRQQVLQLQEREETASRAVELLRALRLEKGGSEIERMRQQIAEAERSKPQRLKKRELAQAACDAMGWGFSDNVVWFVQRIEAARQHLECSATQHEALEQERLCLGNRLTALQTEFDTTVRQVRAMETRRSNIPYELQDVRDRVVAALRLPENALPFAGELIEVAKDEARWQGAIERVLGGFAKSLLVDEKHYSEVSSCIDEMHLGVRLIYHRMIPQTSGNRTPSPDSLVRKLILKAGLCKSWLAEELKSRFDLVCVETLQELRAAPRAVTIRGQVKHNSTRHEKDDRTDVNDRRYWVLGFDSAEKLALFKARAQQLAAEITAAQQALAAARAARDQALARDRACTTLKDMTWSEVDVASLVDTIAQLTRQVQEAERSSPELSRLEGDIQVKERLWKAACERKDNTRDDLRDKERRLKSLDNQIAALQQFPGAALTPLQAATLAQRFERNGPDTLTPETLDNAARTVERSIAAEKGLLAKERGLLYNEVVNAFREFRRRWEADAGGLDPVLESAADFLAKLQRLEVDNLPQFEERFFRLLTQQSDENLTLLQGKLKDERMAISARLETVNESLSNAPYNEGTHLVIQIEDHSPEEVRRFQASVREVLSNSFSTDRDVAEQRFKALAAIVKRLGSQDTDDKAWRSRVLDVRQHVAFIAREMDDNQRELERFGTGSGKSGGQRQKLAATILAAALRYQLGGSDRAWPVFCTVAMDEAFDKADSDFTATSLNIFRQFGFQMVVATPLKNVMTLEPFIGSASFVHIKERRKSLCIPLMYDEDSHKLALDVEVRSINEQSEPAVS